MNTLSQFFSAIMMAVAVGSYFGTYKATSATVLQPRRRDRRKAFRLQTYDRRKLTDDSVWSFIEYWTHRTVWIFVAATFLVVFSFTFGPKIGLIH